MAELFDDLAQLRLIVVVRWKMPDDSSVVAGRYETPIALGLGVLLLPSEELQVDLEKDDEDEDEDGLSQAGLVLELLIGEVEH